MGLDLNYCSCVHCCTGPKLSELFTGVRRKIYIGRGCKDEQAMVENKTKKTYSKIWANKGEK